MVVGTLKISLDRLGKKQERNFAECCSVSCCDRAGGIGTAGTENCVA